MTNAGPLSDRRRFAPNPRTAWTLFTGGVTLYLIYRVRVVPKSVDLAVYRATGAAAAHGGSIYGKLDLIGHLRATYPPFAALVFVPLSAFPLTTLRYLVLAMNVLLLLVDRLGLAAQFTYLPGRTHSDLYQKGDDKRGLLKNIAVEMGRAASAVPQAKPPPDEP